MIEVVIPLSVAFLFVAGGLTVWRWARGPATRWSGRLLRALLLSVIGMGLITAAVWNLSKSRTFQFFGGLVRRVETGEPVVALTFDDGPTAEYTTEVLAILAEQNVKATFFVVGQALADNMPAAQQIVAAGHELGNHTYSHQRMILKSYPTVQQEVESTNRLIREAGYTGPIHFRPPYSKRFLVLPYYLHQTGQLSIFMDVEPESDPAIAGDTGRIVADVLENARPGSIILLHVMMESRAVSRAALPNIIQGLRERGYRFVTVSELLEYDSR